MPDFLAVDKTRLTFVLGMTECQNWGEYIVVAWWYYDHWELTSAGNLSKDLPADTEVFYSGFAGMNVKKQIFGTLEQLRELTKTALL